MTNAEVIANIDNAMAKLQLLTILFDGETDTNMCHEGIMYVVDGITHDLCNVSEGLDEPDEDPSNGLIDFDLHEGVRLARELGVTCDELADAIIEANKKCDEYGDGISTMGRVIEVAKVLGVNYEVMVNACNNVARTTA